MAHAPTVIVPSGVTDRPVTLAVRKWRKIGNEVFNAESMGAGRVVEWNTVAHANIRAEQIRNRGFTARRIGRTVYVGPPQKNWRTPNLKPRLRIGDSQAGVIRPELLDQTGRLVGPRADYDWGGTHGMTQKELGLD